MKCNCLYRFLVFGIVLGNARQVRSLLVTRKWAETMKTVVKMQNTRFGVPPSVVKFTTAKRANREMLLSLGHQLIVQSTPFNGFASCSDHGSPAIILRAGKVRAANVTEM